MILIVLIPAILLYYRCYHNCSKSRKYRQNTQRFRKQNKKMAAFFPSSAVAIKNCSKISKISANTHSVFATTKKKCWRQYVLARIVAYSRGISTFDSPVTRHLPHRYCPRPLHPKNTATALLRDPYQNVSAACRLHRRRLVLDSQR